MKKLVRQLYTNTMVIFSQSWWLWMAASVVFVILGVYGLSALPLRVREKALSIIAFAMLFDFVFLMFYYQNHGIDFATSIIPLQLCSFVKIFCIITILTRMQGFFEMALLIGMFAPFQSIITPGFAFVTPYYLIHYFIVHLLFIIIPTVFVRDYGMRPRPGSWWKVVLKIVSVVPFIWVVNRITGGNYMFVSSQPSVSNPLTIGPWPIYFLIWIGLVTVVSFCVYKVTRNLSASK